MANLLEKPRCTPVESLWNGEDDPFAVLTWSYSVRQDQTQTDLGYSSCLIHEPLVLNTCTVSTFFGTLIASSTLCTSNMSFERFLSGFGLWISLRARLVLTLKRWHYLLIREGIIRPFRMYLCFSSDDIPIYQCIKMLFHLFRAGYQSRIESLPCYILDMFLEIIWGILICKLVSREVREYKRFYRTE